MKTSTHFPWKGRLAMLILAFLCTASGVFAQSQEFNAVPPLAATTQLAVANSANTATEFLVFPSDVGGAGTIRRIGLRISDLATPFTYTGFRVYMRHTAEANFAATSYGNLKTLYDTLAPLYNGNFTIGGTNNEYYYITLTTPFAYNGVDNLAVFLVRNNNQPSAPLITWTCNNAVASTCRRNTFATAHIPNTGNIAASGFRPAFRILMNNPTLACNPNLYIPFSSIGSSATVGLGPATATQATEFLIYNTSIPTSGTVNSLSMFVSPASFPMGSHTFNNVKLFVRTTTDATLPSLTYGGVKALYDTTTPAFSGSIVVTGPNPQWVTINLTTPIAYTAGQNIAFFLTRLDNVIAPASITQQASNTVANSARRTGAVTSDASNLISTSLRPVVRLGIAGAPGTAINGTIIESVGGGPSCFGSKTFKVPAFNLPFRQRSSFTFQWQDSVAGGPSWNNISGANDTIFSGTINTDTYVRLAVSCAGGPVRFSNQLRVKNPLGTVAATGASRCGPGTATVNATFVGDQLVWYKQGGGKVLSTTNSYLANVSSTTTFSATTVTGPAFAKVGPATTEFNLLQPDNITSNQANYIDLQGLVFDVLSPTGIVIDSVDVRFNDPPGASYEWQVQKSDGTPIATITGTTNFQNPTIERVPIKVFVPAGTGYRLVKTAGPALLSFITGSAFPYTLPGMIRITGNSTTFAGYFFFFNWRVTDGCYSAASNATVTVTTPPTLTINPTPANANVCVGSSVTLSASTGYTTYTWTPSLGLDDSTQRVVIAAPSTATRYFLEAVDGNPDPNAACRNRDTIDVTVNLPPTGINNSAAEYCISTPGNLVAAGAPRFVGQVGNGTVNFNPDIFGGSGQAAFRKQFIITKAQMLAAGFADAPAFITSIIFQTSGGNTTQPYVAFKVKMANTTATDFGLAGGSLLNPAFTTCFNQNVTFQRFTWWELAFTQAFSWDGVSNILVETCYDSHPQAAVDFLFGTTTSPRTFVDANSGGCTVASTIFNGTASVFPNMRLRGGSVNYNWTTNDASGSPLAALSATNIASPVFNAGVAGPGNKSYRVTITDNIGCTNAFNVNFSVVASGGIWKGTDDDVFTNANNWTCRIAPGPGVPAVIPFNSNFSTINVNFADTVAGLTIASNKTLALNGALLRVEGPIVNNGRITDATPGNGQSFVLGTGSSYTGVGSTTLKNAIIDGSFTAIGGNLTSEKVVVNASGTLNVASGGRVTVTDSISMLGAATINNTAGGALVLASTSTRTGRTGRIPATATWNGNVTQERWFNPALSTVTGAYFFVGSTVRGKILSDYEAFTPITYAPATAPSVWTYDPNFAQNSGWQPISNPSTAMDPGTGVRLFLRHNPFWANSGHTIRMTGAPELPASRSYTIPVNFCASGCLSGINPNGWTLVANPYNSPISWSRVFAASTNVDNNIAIFQHKARNYAQFAGGIGTNGGSNDIAIGQGFFAFGNSAGASLTFPETAKISAAGGVKSSTTLEIPGFRMTLANSANETDEAVVVFRGNSVRAFEGMYDARKMSGASVSIASLPVGPATPMAINSMPMLQGRDSVYLQVMTASAGTYSLTFTEMDYLGYGNDLTLRDNFTGQESRIIAGMPYNFVVNSNPASQGNSRFVVIIESSNTTSIAAKTGKPSLAVYPNPASAEGVNVALNNFGFGKASLRVLDVLGRTVHTQVLEGAEGVAIYRVNTQLAKGVYTISVDSPRGTYQEKLVVE